MTEPVGAALSRSRPALVPRRLRRRLSSGSFFIFMERRLAGPGDLVREALVGELAGATPVGTANLRVQRPGLGMGLRPVVILGSQSGGWEVGEACAHLVGKCPLAQPSLAVALGSQVPGVWGPPQEWGCTRSRLQAPHCQVPQAPNRLPQVAWPRPAPICDCWAPGSADRPPVKDFEMPQGWGAPLLQPGMLRGPGALVLEGSAPGAGLGGLAESKGVRPRPPGPQASKRAAPAQALPPAGNWSPG